MLPKPYFEIRIIFNLMPPNELRFNAAKRGKMKKG